MWEKIRNRVPEICHVLEFAASALVLIGILLSFISIITDFSLFHELLSGGDAFHHFLERILTIVIGIEFLQMLCRPSSDNVIEILIFLVARHMIVGVTNPYEDFISVVSIALLFLLRRYLHKTKAAKSKEKEETNT